MDVQEQEDLCEKVLKVITISCIVKAAVDYGR
jgi:hypothetical protein